MLLACACQLVSNCRSLQSVQRRHRAGDQQEYISTTSWWLLNSIASWNKEQQEVKNLTSAWENSKTVPYW